ncbi:MAG: hypothetical protein EBE86_011410 [Hormoscilla sp. GUM202]|nr:hypothetical protein [Hormoscilla sp. GUM202]
MSATITIDPLEIQQISQPDRVNSSRLRVLARKAEALAVTIEKEYSEFSLPERELLEALIYSSMGGKSSRLSSLRVRLSLAWILLRGEIDALMEYLNALQRLKKTVLGAIERSHPDYDLKMTEVLSEALSQSDNNPTMTPEEFREWLINISD